MDIQSLEVRILKLGQRVQQLEENLEKTKSLTAEIGSVVKDLLALIKERLFHA